MRRLLALPLDQGTIPQGRLDIAAKVRSNPLPWSGQFSPQLVEALLDAFASAASTVLDPFAGSGTVLYESVRMHKSGLGVEVNPAALTLSRVYEFAQLPPSRRRQILQSVDETVTVLAGDWRGGLFETAGAMRGDAHEGIVRAAVGARDRWERIALQALAILSDAPEGLASDTIQRIWARLRRTIQGLEFTSASLSLFHADARSIPVGDATADFVLTSPPYINVFNYHQQYRGAAEALGWDVLEVAKSEIGSNRKHRANRLLTVIQYCLDMHDVLREIERVTTEEAPIVFVVGRESNVKKTLFFNSDILCALATETMGWSVQTRHERRFTNRFGVVIFEDILHFRRRCGAYPRLRAKPQDVARAALLEASGWAAEGVLADFAAALDGIDQVRQSPVFSVRNALKGE